jgi:hypothetical protein
VASNGDGWIWDWSILGKRSAKRARHSACMTYMRAVKQVGAFMGPKGITSQFDDWMVDAFDDESSQQKLATQKRSRSSSCRRIIHHGTIKNTEWKNPN